MLRNSSSKCRRSTKTRSFSLDCLLGLKLGDIQDFTLLYKGEGLLGCFANFLVIFRCIWEEIIFLKRVLKFGEIIKKYLRFDVV